MTPKQPQPKPHHFTNQNIDFRGEAGTGSQLSGHHGDTTAAKSREMPRGFAPYMKSSSGKMGSKPFKARSARRHSAQLLVVKVWLAERKATLKIRPQHSRFR